ncbi:MAG: hypothetical protein UR39_C0003G0043 [Candidatus Woesebacteria bacterium GW2011_GWA1_33_30]|uniref:Uncharacterized protein n=1 Tax=Candidatus Woesebacteria bacterium GW2011_GWA2_33_28 TaxID=1618561 RepID=A0A0G0A8Q3_9BACT|nr:MAG: hypothetical protein UR38_C0003G0046 [Candidatus Woesebacteria bacterium GW2011_GWA2_33_28]KKP48508.1 MAG: hypothetical protein UR39_C0003G0043 [Candidatus Woesebacteria bacterium GW2011_GWA1_33_30]KKP49647.1 MAG: hypothetical protein UR40_C0004G0046 [Microgenomates group bacterium GW2011_GWC1_33_32]KKP52264.1 MAG: hypothetical protein UR44_C0003G0046 [Candidatus Woesebacteria bacterium GW2011_GWB1_33_38]KKP55686.1 MAG: hypothetical protein UR48_C0055G0007 [Microgenomates group bacteriu
MKNAKLPSLMILLILTTITVVFWISFTIYRVFTKESPVNVSNEIIAPINPNLDMDTLNEIERRVQNQ